jgi:hypothetical protein
MPQNKLMRVASNASSIVIDSGKSYYTEGRDAFKNLKFLFKRNRPKALILLSSSVFILAFSFFLVSGMLFSTPIKPSKVQEPQAVEHIIARGDEKKVANEFLDQFEWVVNILKPVLDGFVGSTPEVTGVTGADQDGKIQFTEGQKVASAKAFYDKSFAVAVLLAMIFIVFQGVNLIAGTEHSASNMEAVKGLVMRVVVFSILLIGGRVIMSLTIQFVNELNNYFRNGSSLTDYLIQFTASVKSTVGTSNSNSFVDGIKNILSLGTVNITSLISALPIILPFLLIILFLLFISFQFIIRWISLYFMSVIQPLASVCYLTKKTANVNENFWKTWTTLLIHQPFFILGYAVLQNILLDNLKSGPSFTAIIIFLATLIFLSSVNVLVGKIYGDAWTAISSNIQAGIGTGAVLAGLNKARQPFTDFKRGAMGGLSNSVSGLAGKQFGKKLNLQGGGGVSLNTSTPFAGKPIPNSFPKISSKKSGPGHTELKNPLGSKNAQTLINSGYQVGANESNGTLGVTGDFFAKSNGDGTSTLYTSKAEAKDNGILENDLRKVSLSGANILDGSNYRAKENYNKTLASFAKQEGIDSKLHLTQSSTQDRVSEGLIKAKQVVQSKNIQGVLVERIGSNIPNTGNSKDAKRQLQLHIYDDLISDETYKES